MQGGAQVVFEDESARQVRFLSCTDSPRVSVGARVHFCDRCVMLRKRVCSFGQGTVLGSRTCSERFLRSRGIPLGRPRPRRVAVRVPGLLVGFGSWPACQIYIYFHIIDDLLRT